MEKRTIWFRNTLIRTFLATWKNCDLYQVDQLCHDLFYLGKTTKPLPFSGSKHQRRADCKELQGKTESHLS
jgi:hypothetical protein